MNFDAQLPQNPAFETSVSQAVPAMLTQWWAPSFTAASADQALGYESALPWTLRDEMFSDSGQPRY